MKHPNKKFEKLNNFKARCRLNSCFNFWLNKAVSEEVKIPLTSKTLIETLDKLYRNSK
jgi:hypothetical protein